jgi:dolichol-phosphate mannosyltransferase
MINDILVSVVAPVYNEEECIKEYISQTIKILQSNYLNYELVLVDDGSTDCSAIIIKEMLGKIKNIRLISLSRNYGREVAITAGLDMSIGDYVVLMDSDLQDPPYLIPKLIDRAISGYDVVYGARTSREGESVFKKLSSKYFYKIASNLTGFSIPSDAGDFRVFNRKVVNSISKLKENNRYMKLLYAYVGFNVSKLHFDRNERYAGITKYSYAKLFNASLDAIISFSNRPLRIVSIFSIMLSFLLLLLTTGIFLYKTFYTNSIVAGWSSIMVFMSLMFSVLFMFLSIISEYIARILTESKNRPLYYIAEEKDSSVLHDNNIVDDL